MFSVTIHPHGSIVAVGDEHGDVTFLNMEDGLHVTTLPVTNSPLYTLKYSPDGDTLAVGCADGNIYLFQTHSNGYMYKIDYVLPGTVPILMLDWSVDGGSLQAVFTDNEYHDIAFACGIIKHIPDAVHVCLSCPIPKQLLAAGDKNGYIRLFRYQVLVIKLLITKKNNAVLM
ncbi:echinoderm microtubule-associated protein-like CG42247 [Caerostris extrusa]|uniref:Echinoderm microtubule-associated protein-like CG42247 n=1 Tax=Caerostris extrusa TaxID=172846 RepID=A0AAV4XNB5_CAEEX|nr:echinoderm microtubule-associated protein-like CG42247 [Caerostris extrusa]